MTAEEFGRQLALLGRAMHTAREFEEAMRRAAAASRTSSNEVRRLAALVRARQ